MRTTVRLDDGLMKAAKQHALDTGRSLTELIRDAIVGILERERGAESPRRVRLPVFHGDGLLERVDLSDTGATLDRMDGFERSDGPLKGGAATR